ncbi:hypothetical protein EIP86_010583 [Pleurotus ostreatoroseus]|nr:hypothetical protein EIP86_010583 [Pleurotus ostreatoroseus]
MTRLSNTWYGEPHPSATTSWRRSMPSPLLEDDAHMVNVRSHAFPSDVRASTRKFGPVWSSANDGSDAQSASTSTSSYSWQQSVIFRPLDTGSSDSDDSHNSHGSDKCPSLNMPGAFPSNAIDNVEVFAESEGPETLQVVFVPSSSFISLRGTVHADGDKSVYSSEQKSSDAIMDAPTIVEFVPKPPPPKLVTCVICFDDHQEDAMVTYPSCDRETFIDRHDYDAAGIITCPFSGCTHSWCKQCSAAVNPRSPGHSCGAKAATKALERLMEKQGWKHCPGCRTPTSKSEGCNHMTVRSSSDLMLSCAF